jgi:hypothetical protein
VTVQLHVFRSDVEWIVGADLEDALTAYERGMIGAPMHPDERDPEGWRQLPDEEPLTIIDDMSLPREQWTRTTKSCSEWAYESGRGFLCSTEW